MLDTILGCFCLLGPVFFFAAAVSMNERRHQQLPAAPVGSGLLARRVHARMYQSVASARMTLAGLSLFILMGALAFFFA